MNLIAIIPSGQTEITVNGLHQWDYGRQLEIHSDELPVSVEVHFACTGMDTAVVRPCSGAGGVAVVSIPDRCLEQTTPITAWVFEINGTSGLTTKKINLPIIARTRPSITEDIPTEVSDKYTEAVTAMNEAVATVIDGGIKVSKASNADYATNAGNAVRANSAAEADFATNAQSADSANVAGQALNSGMADKAKELDALYHHTLSITFDTYIEGAKVGNAVLVFPFSAPRSFSADQVQNLVSSFLTSGLGTQRRCQGTYVQGTHMDIIQGFSCSVDSLGMTSMFLYTPTTSVRVNALAFNPTLTTVQIY